MNWRFIICIWVGEESVLKKRLLLVRFIIEVVILIRGRSKVCLNRRYFFSGFGFYKVSRRYFGWLGFRCLIEG